MIESLEVDNITHKNRVFQMRVGGPCNVFRRVMEPYRSRFSKFPAVDENITGSGEYQYQIFEGYFTGNEITEFKLLTNSKNWVGNMQLDILPVWYLKNLTIPRVKEEVISAIQKYKEVKFHTSRPYPDNGNLDGKYNLEIFTLDEISTEDMLVMKLKGDLYHEERERYYSVCDYLPKIKDKHDGPW